MTLSELTSGTPDSVITGDGSVEIERIVYDSRLAREGDLFVALPGGTVDAREFIGGAIEAGAVAVVAEGAPQDGWNVPSVRVPDARCALASLAGSFHGNPSDDLRVAGITGTNGKSTTALIAKHLLDHSHRRAGLVGTIYYDIGDGELHRATHTTPQSSDLQALLADMRDHGCVAGVMEVSSHGIDQDRVHGIDFKVAVFTNLTQDHLDYHGTMENYFEAKRELFLMTTASGGKLVVNGDDPYGRRLIEEFGEDRCITYGSSTGCTYRTRDWKTTFEGVQFILEAKGRETLVRLPLIGRYNVYNALAALGIAQACGCNFRDSVRALAETPQVPGRLESISSDTPFRVYVDYAHTPDALRNMLAAVRELDPRRLVVVFGCGGNRDRGKRALMAEAAEEGSDVCVLTSDNPRDEDPEQILNDAAKGFRHDHHLRIVDRKEAIQTAIQGARPRDVIVVAGKGHEDYQEVAGERIPFDDRRVCYGCIREVVDEKAEFRREKEMEHRERERDRLAKESGDWEGDERGLRDERGHGGYRDDRGVRGGRGGRRGGFRGRDREADRGSRAPRDQSRKPDGAGDGSWYFWQKAKKSRGRDEGRDR